MLIIALVVLTAVPLSQLPAAASCPTPYIKSSSKLVLERGAATTLEGRAFVEGCRDSMGCSTGLGCDACRWQEPPEVPLRDVSLRLVQADRTWDLAVADAGMAENNQLGWVTWTFEVPVGAIPGPAKLVPEHGEGVRVEIG
ncbi:hypothetical protein [Nocardioides aequoreus]|uniref:hypothetical protein n=1 Tax=Nocardioides aequoreus TaxID=397278 RepID=UPI0004C44879|nr:hypothetical protein [Nocardioides aequoreus]